VQVFFSAGAMMLYVPQRIDRDAGGYRGNYSDEESGQLIYKKCEGQLRGQPVNGDLRIPAPDNDFQR